MVRDGLSLLNFFIPQFPGMHLIVKRWSQDLISKPFVAVMIFELNGTHRNKRNNDST